MANLSSAAVATLVSEITGLRKALEGTLVDNAEIGKRFDAASSGLLTPGGSLDTAKWENLTPAQQTGVEAQLSKLRQELVDLREVYAHEDGPADERSLMYKEYASNKAIIALTVIALLGLFGNLTLICHEWEAATAGTRGILEFGTPSYSTKLAKADAIGLTPTPSPASSERSDLTTKLAPTPAQSVVSITPGPSPETASAATATPPATSKSPARSPAAGLTATAPHSPSDENKEDKKELVGKVTEQAVLWMVILLGALGGFLYLASSMATYVGNRQLLRSWIVYYILIPFQGAALAPLIYLLLRVGVLNPANPTSSGRPMESLNLMGIYAFAALTGLFSKQAIEMLADVFATIFKKVSAKDSLEKSKTDTEKTGK